jgi:hypothetical protein
MRVRRIAPLLLVLMTLPLFSPMMAHGDGKDDKHGKHVRVSEYAEGNAYCPRRPMTIGAVVVPAGRCYTLAMLRNQHGAYLAFLDPAIRLRRDRVARLTDWEGRHAWGGVLFLVPIPGNAQIALIPVNTIQLIRLRQEDDEDDDEDRPQVRRSTLVVVAPASITPNVSVTFVITF